MWRSAAPGTAPNWSPTLRRRCEGAAKALRETLEAATGERVSALEGIGAALDKPIAEEKARGRGVKAGPEAAGKTMEVPDRYRDAGPEMAPEPRQKSVEMDFGL